MKKILFTLICLAFVASQSMAQYGNYNNSNSNRRSYNNSNNNSNSNSNSNRSSYNNNNSYSNNNYRPGSWLDDMSYDAPDLYRSYRSGKTLSGLGMGFTIGGLAMMVIGVATADTDTQSSGTQTTVYLSGDGAAVFGLGLVFTLVGTPIWIVGSAKKRNAKNAYFREFGELNLPTLPSPYLKLNSTSNGMGLAYVF
jgi:hypothetical protein